LELTLQGKLIIASPKLNSGMFAGTVILITDHSPEGTIGVVLNRPSKTRVNSLLTDLNLSNISSSSDDLIYMGGPIQERNVWLLHTPEWYSASTHRVSRHFSISNDTFMLEKMAMDNFPLEWAMYAGTAGWAPGQLDTEIKQDLWLTLDANPALVFSSNKENLWSLSIEVYSQTMVENFF
jgi:putative transcriptional regulator